MKIQIHRAFGICGRRAGGERGAGRGIPASRFAYLDDYESAPDEKSLVIRDFPSHKYTITFLSRCVGLRFTEAIAVRSVGDIYA